MLARIFQPARTAMQSGDAQTKAWVLEYEQEAPRGNDPLMGWTSSGDMRQQLKLRFDSMDEAVAYAEAHGIAYTVTEPKPRAATRKAYADNFKYGRDEPWTH